MQSQTNLGLNEVITFDRIGLNLGNGFNAAQGIFIAPRAGVYLFASSIMANQNHPEEIHAAMTVNGNTVARIYGHGDNGRHDQGANTIIVDLQMNDEVMLKNIDLEHEVVDGGLYSSFSGALLYDM